MEARLIQKRVGSTVPYIYHRTQIGQRTPIGHMINEKIGSGKLYERIYMSRILKLRPAPEYCLGEEVTKFGRSTVRDVYDPVRALDYWNVTLYYLDQVS
jgi:hypothetical protein